MPLLLASTCFASAFLLFLMEPMAARMILPLFGGAPAVWSTCLVFFQGALLAGYAYAHGSVAWLGARRQAVAHAAVVLLPLLLLPMHIDTNLATWPPEASPVGRLLLLLALAAGLPFAVLATTAPLVQKWHSLLERGNPYFLYAASNAGSLLALLSYPLVFERWIGLEAQARVWAIGYGLFAVLSLSGSFRLQKAEPQHDATVRRGALAPGARVRWLVLSAVPSALLVSATTYLGSNVATFPLLWVLPLALYLLTFILSFGTRRLISIERASRLLPLPAAAVFILLSSEAAIVPLWALFSIHLTLLFLACMVCHGRLADERPEPSRLTDYYLSVSAGGVLGGAIAALLAPVLFSSVIEYPLEILAACALRPPPRAAEDRSSALFSDLRWAAMVGAMAVLLGFAAHRLGLAPGRLTIGLAIGIPMLVHYGSLDRPRRFALGLGAIFSASFTHGSTYGSMLHSERSFFGVLRVTEDATGTFRQIVNETVVHGRQALDPLRRDEPTGYYDRKGPIGAIFREALDPREIRRVGIIGLGCGSLAPYRKPGQEWTFFEIDPAVERVARDPHWFTFLADSFPKDEGLRVVVGDARVRLRAEPSGTFDVLILDAFSSDAIPVHLLVREAFALYLDKLAPDGLLALHISNYYFDVEPVVAASARASGLSTLCWANLGEPSPTGKLPSEWCAAARLPARLAGLSKPEWRAPRGAETRAWTDDRADVLGALRLLQAQ